METRQTLLVLDNFEHLLAGAELLPPLLRGAPGLKLLVTSRARLHLAEEWLLPLGGLATPPAAAAAISATLTLPAAANNADLADFPSMRLFLQRMQRLDPSFRPTLRRPGSRSPTICRLLEGMPLAIELAAAWVRSLSLAEIAAAVRGRLELFTTNLARYAERATAACTPSSTTPGVCSTPMNGICCASWLFFAAAAPWPRPTAVTGATPADLESLVDKSWLRVQEHRFTLHELMRQYCAERLDQEHEIVTGEAADDGAPPPLSLLCRHDRRRGAGAQLAARADEPLQR